MNLPVNINDMLSGRSVEWERLEFKAGWNPQEVIRTLCAFANDFHNLGGGYLFIGIKEDNGRPILPPVGLPKSQLDSIQKEIIELGHRIIPYYHPVISPHEINGKYILVLWATGGQSRPYKAPVSLAKKNREYAYYIRKGSLTVRAGYQDEVELMGLTAKVPFDDRMHHSTTPKDLDLGLIRTYLRQVGSDLYETSAAMDFVQLSRQMNIVDGPDEAVRPKNVGLMFFNEQPDRFFPQAQIDVVNFPEGPGADSFTEKIFKGPLNRMLAEALSYINSMVIQEKVIKHSDRPEATRCFNYPFAAVKEALCNAVYHRSYEIREPVEVRILPDAITVTSFPGPDRSIGKEDIERFRFVARRYRNRRIGEFLKELDLTEGRGTGIPKILRNIEANGSPLPRFLTDEERTYFVVEFPIHPAFLPVKIKKEKGLENGARKIISLLEEEAGLTIKKISKRLGISTRAVEKHLRSLKETGQLKRQGGRKSGWWKVIE
jgi:ATP-dependent DNA helicase RecG